MMSPKCSIFPTFSFSLINKTHRRCQDSRLFHSQRFSFEFLFTLKRWKRAFRTSRQNNTFFSKMRPECVRQRDAGEGLSSAKRSVASWADALQSTHRLTLLVPVRGLPFPNLFLLTTAQQKHSQQKKCVNEKRAPRPTSLFRAKSCRYCTMKLGLCVQVYPHTHFLRVQLTRFCAARYGSTTERVCPEHHVRRWNPDVKILPTKSSLSSTCFRRQF